MIDIWPSHHPADGDNLQDIKVLLKTLQRCGELQALDRHFALEMARLHGEDSPLFLLTFALVSRQLTLQHTCLDLSQLSLDNIFDSPLDASMPRVRITCERQTLIKNIADLPGIGTPQDNKPLILDGHRLYLRRYHEFECHVAQRLLSLSGQKIPLAANTATTLVALFQGTAATDSIDWQQVAVAIAAGEKLTVITGGPGTGKTTTVTKLLLLLNLLESNTDKSKPAIRMAAPTGKAAARLSESIKASKQRLKAALDPSLIPTEAIDALPEEASTLHRLLGFQAGNGRFRHNHRQPLDLDLLLIDEASMVDLPMMARLLDALPIHARLILLGDQDQLASVEAGAVLADICAGANTGHNYSERQTQSIRALTGVNLTPSANAPGLGDNLCRLQYSHRFAGDAGIGQLAQAVNQGDARRAEAIWTQGFSELHWIAHGSKEQQGAGLKALVSLAVEQYREYLNAMALFAAPTEILELYNQFRVLCAMHVGDYGVEGINRAITAALARHGLIHPAQEFYAGRPVIIQNNDYSLGLFNGDIGILLPIGPTDPRLMALFIQTNGNLLKVLPARLPGHDTCYAMTVHKSQGSEFANVALALPPSLSPAQEKLIGRELVYTAITRAKQRFICLGNKRLFAEAVERRTLRSSGLADRLWSGAKI